MSELVADLDAPAVVAGKVARIQAQIDRWALVAILLGLAFTMVNVQTFAAAGAAVWTLPWLAAWLLDPMVSILLLVVVRAEQVTARWQVAMAWQVTATKWVAFAATYVMNTWSSIEQGVWSDIVLHSVPPVFVLIGAEVLPKLREGLTEAVLKARAYASTVAAGSSERPHDLPPLPPPPDATASGTPPAGVDCEADPGDRRAPVDGQAAQTHAFADVTDRDGPVAVGGWLGPDPAVRASISDATDRLLRHVPSPESRPGSQERPDTTHDDGDIAAAQSPDPVEVVASTAGTSAQPRPRATAEGAPRTAESARTEAERAPDTARESDPATGDDLDPRVLSLVEQLRGNSELTGPEAVAALEAAGFGPVAARTARRLLSKARDALAPTSGDTEVTEASSSPAAAVDAAGDTTDDDVPGGQTPTPWAPPGTDAGRPLALVRPAASTPTGDR